MWKILDEYKKNKRTIVLVQCNCGVIEERRKDHVLSGRTKMCKRCSTVETAKKTRNTSSFFNLQHQGKGWLTKTRFNVYKYGAERRDLTFNITLEDAWSLLVKQNHRCALSNVSIGKGTASIDRIDSSKGYELNNIHWIHRDLNYMKNDMHIQKFLFWCSLVHANQQPS